MILAKILTQDAADRLEVGVGALVAVDTNQKPAVRDGGKWVLVGPDFQERARVKMGEYQLVSGELVNEFDRWSDLRSRLGRAHETLHQESLRYGVDSLEYARLRGKAEGVSLAIDYMRGY